MKNKGYTLAELLGVMVILTILAALVVTNVRLINENAKKNLYTTQIETIKNAAQILVTDLISVLPEEKGQSVTIELKLLKDLDILKQDIKNPQTENYFKDEMLITLTSKGSNFDVFVYPEDSDTYSKKIKYEKHIILLKGEEVGENTSTNLKENFIVLTPTGRVYDLNDYTVSIEKKVKIDDTYSAITYKIDVVDEEQTTTYTMTRKENCQSGICN